MTSLELLTSNSPAYQLTEDELTERHRDIPLADQVARQLEINIAAGIVNLVVPPVGMDQLAARIGAAA